MMRQTWRGAWVGLSLWLLWMLAPPSLTAQRLGGRVRDVQGGPLAGVNVWLPRLERGTTTDAQGRYGLDTLPADTHAVTFSFVGFRTEARTVVVARGQRAVTLDVVLHPVVVEVDEVVITADHAAQERLTRSAQAVSVLDLAQLDALRGETLGEMLDHLPGVTTLTTGPSIAKPVVRGLHSDRVLVLNAGVPQEGQQWGGEHAPEIDPFAPARIEVVKGAAGVEYGVGAIGGVIRVEPRDLPTAAGVGGQVVLNGFSNNRQGAGSVLLEGGTGRLPGLGWRLQGSFRKAGDARAPGYVMGNTGFAEQHGNAALGYHRARVGLDAYYSRFSTELGIYQGAHINNLADLQRAIALARPLFPYDFTYDIRPPKQQIVHDLATVRGHWQQASGGLWQVQYGYQHNHRQEFDAHRLGAEASRPAFELTLRTHTLDLRYRRRPSERRFGVVGLTGMNQGNLNGASGFLIPNFRALTGGLFVRETWVGTRWTLETGLRYDYRWMRAWPFDRTARQFVRTIHRYHSLSGVVGVILRWGPAWSVAFNAGTAWRPPSVNELYSFGVHHGTAQVETGDPSLQGERSFDTNATLRHAGERVELEVSVYHNYFQDYLFLFPDPEPTVTIRGVFPTFFYTQADARLMGVDGDLFYHLSGAVELGTSFAWLRANNLEADLPLYGMPSNRLRLHAHVRLPSWGAFVTSRIEVETAFVAQQGRIPPGVDYAPPPDGYTTTSLTALGELDLGGVPVHLSIGVQNLFNAAYRDYLSRFRYFIDEQGRNVVVRLRLPFGRFQL